MGILLWLVLWAGREGLEERMWTHSLLLLPALTACGACWAPRSRPLKGSGSALLLMGLFGAAFWMLPRNLDASLADSTMSLAKFVTLPALVGFPLAWGYRELRAVARRMLASNLVLMLFALGWLYHALPTRVCNYYLQSEQAQLGTGYLVIAATLVVWWLPRWFLGPGASSAPGVSERDSSEEAETGVTDRDPVPR